MVRALFLLFALCGTVGLSAQPLFSEMLIDENRGKALWGKAYGDINGDGLPDLVVGGNSGSTPSLIDRIKIKLGLQEWPRGAVIWYENPSWTPHLISTHYSIRTDLAVADINDDGLEDFVLLTNDGLLWLRSPSWQPSPIIDDNKFHDVEVADLDNDGRMDIVVRNQSLFGYENGNQIVVFQQQGEHEWRELRLNCPHGEGLMLSDMNNDGFIDILVNKVGLINPGNLDHAEAWQTFHYAQDWEWDDIYLDVADFNQDGLPDIVLSPAEEAGQFYELAWFEAPAQLSGIWKKHIVDPNVEAVLHFVAAADADNDGDVDVFTAEMNQSQDPDQVLLYLAEEDGSWTKTVLSDQGSHSMKVLDVDLDLDMDLFGADWYVPGNEFSYPVSLWRNQSSEKYAWQRIEIDSQRPGKSIFVFAGDINGDKRVDIASGGYWYAQPALLTDHWVRSPLGEGANNIAWLDDLDGDGDLDVLASGWKGTKAAPTLKQRIFNRLGIEKFDYQQHGELFVWGENDGAGRFAWRSNIEPARGDFLQGVVDFVSPAGEKQIVLSWHNSEESLQSFLLPKDIKNQQWTWQEISKNSQSEQLTRADLDGDGRDDLLLGTRWLKDVDQVWRQKSLFETELEPDRNAAADINGDGVTDVVIGYQAVSKPGRLAWYERNAQTETWQEHLISEQVIGPMSLSVADFDLDSDLDVVVGEHNLKHPERARLILFENKDGKGARWVSHLLHMGDEHHDGALAVDLDGDGDTDIVSIGFSHHKVVAYINPARS